MPEQIQTQEPAMTGHSAAGLHAERQRTARFFGPQPRTDALTGIYESFRYGRNFTIGRAFDNFVERKFGRGFGSDPITEEEFYENDLDLYGHLEWRPDMTLDQYNFIRERKIEELSSLMLLENMEGGLGTSALSLVAGMVGSMAHPVDVMAMFLPTGVGKAGQSIATGMRTANLGGRRVAVPALSQVARQYQVGFKSGLITAAWAEPVIYTGQRQMQGDYTLADSALNFAFTPFASGALHVGFGTVGSYKRLRSDTKELMAREAFYSAMFGEDRGPVMAKLYQLDPKVYESMAGMERMKDIQRLATERQLTDAELAEARTLVDRMESGSVDRMAADPFHRPRMDSRPRNTFNRLFAETRTQEPRTADEIGLQRLAQIADPNTKLRFYDGVYEVNAYGAVLPRTPDTIYIARQRLNDMVYVLGHEFGHSAKWRAPELWKQIIDVIDRSAKSDAAIRKAVKDAIDKQGQAFLNLHPAKRLDEAYANIMGEVFQSRAFWQELHRHRPDAFTKLVNWLKHMFREISNRLRGDGPPAHAKKMQEEIARILTNAESISPVRSSHWKPGDFKNGREFMGQKHEFLFNMDRFRGIVSDETVKTVMTGLSQDMRLNLIQALDDAHYDFGPLIVDAAIRKTGVNDWRPVMRKDAAGNERPIRHEVSFRVTDEQISQIRTNATQWAEKNLVERRGWSRERADAWIEDKVAEEIKRKQAFNAVRAQNYLAQAVRNAQSADPESLFGSWPVFVDERGRWLSPNDDPARIHSVQRFKYVGGEAKALARDAGEIEAFLRYGDEEAFMGQGPVTTDPSRTRVLERDPYSREDYIPKVLQDKLLEFERTNKNSPEARRLWGDLLEEPDFQFFHKWLSGQPREKRAELLTDYREMLREFDRDMIVDGPVRDTADIDFDPFFRALRIIDNYSTGHHVTRPRVSAKEADEAARAIGLTRKERQGIGRNGPTPELISKAWKRFVQKDADARDLTAIHRMLHWHLSGRLEENPNRPWMLELGMIDGEAQSPGRLHGEGSYDPAYIDDPTILSRTVDDDSAVTGLMDSDLETQLFRTGDEMLEALGRAFDHRPLPLDLTDSLQVSPSPDRGKRFHRLIDSMKDSDLDTIGKRIEEGARAFIDNEGNLVLRQQGQADNTYRWTEDPDRVAYRRDMEADEADLMAASPNYSDHVKSLLHDLMHWERTARSKPALAAAAGAKMLRQRLERTVNLDHAKQVEVSAQELRINDFVVTKLSEDRFEFPALRVEEAPPGTEQLIRSLNGRYLGAQKYWLQARRNIVDRNAQKAENYAAFKILNDAKNLSAGDKTDFQQLYHDLRALHTRHKGNEAAMLADLQQRVSRELAADQFADIRQFEANIRWQGAAVVSGISKLHSMLDGGFRKRVRKHSGLGNNVFTNMRREMAEAVSPFIAVLQKNDAWTEFRQNGKFTEEVILHMESGHSTDPRVREVAESARLIWDTLYNDMRAMGSNIEYLPDFSFSQRWDMKKTRDTPFEQWAQEMSEALDWERMAQYNGRLGRWDEAAGKVVFENLDGYLRNVYDDIISGRLRERDTATDEIFGGNIARQVAEHRTLVFKPGQAFRMDMKYGSGNTGQVVLAQMARRANLVTLMREVAPNLGKFRRDMVNLLESRRGQVQNLTHFERLVDPTGAKRFKMIFDKLTGDVDRPENLALGKFGKTLRQLADMAVLGQSTITAFSMDPAHMADQFRWMGMPLNDAYSNMARAVAEGAKRRARLDNLDAEAMLMGSSAGFDAYINAASRRFGGDISDLDMVGLIHGRFFDINGMNTWNMVGQGAVVDVTQRWFGDMAMRVRNNEPLPKQFLNALRRFDISEGDFRAMAETAAEYPVFMGERTAANRNSWLNGPRIVKQDLPSVDLQRKYGNFLDEAMRFGILEPTVTEAAYLGMGLQAGTIEGEAMRLITKYMSFPLSVGRKTYRRMLNGYGEDGMRELSSMGMTQGTMALMQFMPILLMGSATALGIKDVLAGRDPVGRMTPARMMRILDNSGALVLAPDILGYRAVPPASTAYDFVRGAASADFYKTSNAVMDTVPGNNLPLINEAKKAIMAAIFEDWYGTANEARLQFFERQYGTSSILQTR